MSYIYIYAFQIRNKPDKNIIYETLRCYLITNLFHLYSRSSLFYWPPQSQTGTNLLF